jgi:hypothetical protein
MSELEKGRVSHRRRPRRFSGVLRFGHLLSVWCMRKCIPDLGAIFGHMKLFLGVVFVTVGVLSFASDRYCDGAVVVHGSCTRPATFYYYPWWAVTLVAVGAVLIALWAVRREGRGRPLG